MVALRLILHFDTSRTAQVLGIEPNTVMAHMTQAMAALRRDLTPESQQGGHFQPLSSCRAMTLRCIWLVSS